MALRSIVSSMLTGAVLVSLNVDAVTFGSVPIPPDSVLSGFGSSQVYRGQTFRLPSDVAVFANSLTVFVGPTTDFNADFRVLVTEVDMTSGFHPTTVLFESGDLNVPIFPLRRDPDEFVIDLGGILLQPDRDYAWILDHFVLGSEGTFVSMGTGLGSYADGFGVQFVNGPTFPEGDREDHFASNNWFLPINTDFAFQMEVTAVPIPGAIWLFGSSIIGLIGVARRKKA